MHSFAYKNGALHCEGVNLQDIAAAVGTPTFVYSKKTILDDLEEFRQALAPLDAHIAYAVKACSNKAILHLMAQRGVGFDIVSGGELWRIVNAGGDPTLCTYAGVAKTEAEIRYALELGIYCFNCESENELREINRIAGEMGVKAPVAVRVNPNVDAHTHKYITTGTNENKFGVDISRIEALYATIAAEMPHLHIKGLQMHIGSQLTDKQPFVTAIEKVAPIVAKFKELYGIEFWSIGGGIGIVYDGCLASGSEEWWAEHPEQITIRSYAESIIPLLRPLGLKILIEPGRRLVGNAAAMLTTCVYEKKGEAKTFKMIDAGMNDIIRPALYEGYHEIWPVQQHSGDSIVADIVGPICESGDFQAQNRLVADVKPGEVLAEMSAGAYGFSMASTYNSRPLAAEVLVDGDKWHLIRRRQTMEQIVEGELLPGEA
ncbi:MAG: diaminopimelate decarboxylase [Akkermansiaceae bacterium]|nr:diaminopimelate decarboxylase [Akkermansiaceae bacterium]